MSDGGGNDPGEKELVNLKGEGRFAKATSLSIRKEWGPGHKVRREWPHIRARTAWPCPGRKEGTDAGLGAHGGFCFLSDIRS